MAETICLTDDETAALREIIAALSVIEERGFASDQRVCEITVQMWRDMLVRPAQRLRRVTTRALSPTLYRAVRKETHG